MAGNLLSCHSKVFSQAFSSFKMLVDLLVQKEYGGEDYGIAFLTSLSFLASGPATLLDRQLILPGPSELDELPRSDQACSKFLH
jgi:hypothetical protein